VLFSTIYGIILPIDELIFFRGVGQPPSSNDSHYGMADFVIYRTDPKCQMVLDPIPKSLSQKLFGSIDIHSIFFRHSLPDYSQC